MNKIKLFKSMESFKCTKHQNKQAISICLDSNCTLKYNSLLFLCNECSIYHALHEKFRHFEIIFNDKLDDLLKEINPIFNHCKVEGRISKLQEFLMNIITNDEIISSMQHLLIKPEKSLFLTNNQIPKDIIKLKSNKLRFELKLKAIEILKTLISNINKRIAVLYAPKNEIKVLIKLIYYWQTKKYNKY